MKLIEILFPFSIDHMEEETSIRKTGCIPLFANDLETLLSLLGNENNNKKQILFGFNTVILVKNQKSKNKIPSKLADLLCLTIYESKVTSNLYYYYSKGIRI